MIYLNKRKVRGKNRGRRKGHIPYFDLTIKMKIPVLLEPMYQEPITSLFSYLNVENGMCPYF